MVSRRVDMTKAGDCLATVMSTRVNVDRYIGSSPDARGYRPRRCGSTTSRARAAGRWMRTLATASRAEQLKQAGLIAALRQLHVPLAEITRSCRLSGPRRACP